MNKSTEIVMLLDRSGSMATVKDDTIGGFNRFLEQQAKIPDANVTLVQFDDRYEQNYAGIPVAKAEKLTNETFVPRGWTALYDALCRLIDETGDRLSKLAEAARPGLVIFVVQTDGHENASKKFTSRDVQDRITRQQDVYKWQFVFLGANQDAIASARAIGISPNTAMSYAANEAGTKAAYDVVTNNVGAARMAVLRGQAIGAAVANLSFSDEDRKRQRDLGAVVSSK